jgi:uncharacterized protein (TIGR04255 family)
MLNIDEKFGHLSKAPVVEAVLELRSRVETEWDEVHTTKRLRELLPEFPKVESLRTLMHEVVLEPSIATVQNAADLGWVGVLMKTADEKQIVRFERDAFSYSQLAPYPGWDAFIDRALQLWNLRTAESAHNEIARIGLRFINRIAAGGPNEDLQKVLVAAPVKPDDLPLPYAGFLHRDVFEVPGYDYAVLTTRTIQPMASDATTASGLIIDIDVFTTKPATLTIEELRARLREMRWLKNKTFFGSLTNEAKSDLL